MFNIFKKKQKPSKKLYIVWYNYRAKLSGENNGKIEFDSKDMQYTHVFADNAMNAGVEFAKRFVLYPHVYVHEIKEAAWNPTNDFNPHVRKAVFG